MSKSDVQLQKDVIDELAFEPSLDESNLAVAAKDGVITLSGVVKTFAEKLAAERAAKRVLGVRGVAEELEVDLPALHVRTDSEIAAAVLSMLAWDITLPASAISVKVEKGWLTLEGHVDWHYQREHARDAVVSLAGVRGVTNLITVRQQPAVGDVHRKIRDTFERSAEIDAGRLNVEVHDGTVVVRGPVHSWAEHDDAARAAYSVAGVSKVENLTHIG